MELTIEQKLQTRQFAINAAIQIYNLDNSGRILSINTKELKPINSEDFLKEWNRATKDFKPMYTATQEAADILVDWVNTTMTILKIADKIYQWVTETIPKTSKDDGITR